MIFSTIIENVPKELATNAPMGVLVRNRRPKREDEQNPDKSEAPAETPRPDDPATWGTFEEAVEFSRENDLPGIGFVFSER